MPRWTSGALLAAVSDAVLFAGFVA